MTFCRPNSCWYDNTKVCLKMVMLGHNKVNKELNFMLFLKLIQIWTSSRNRRCGFEKAWRLGGKIIHSQQKPYKSNSTTTNLGIAGLSSLSRSHPNPQPQPCIKQQPCGWKCGCQGKILLITLQLTILNGKPFISISYLNVKIQSNS